MCVDIKEYKMEINDNLDVKGTLTAATIRISEQMREKIACQDDTLDAVLIGLWSILNKTTLLALDCDARLNELSQTLASVKAENEKLATGYNKAIEVINDLSERLTALESNYDPTVIK